MQVNPLRIEFEKSRSYYFNAALEIAKRIPSFEERDLSGVTTYSVYFTPEYFDNFVELARATYGWKTARILVGDRVLKKTDYYRLFTVYDCYRRRQEFTNPKYYCFVSDGYYGTQDQAFPCKQIRLTLRDVIQRFGEPSCAVQRFGEPSRNGPLHLNKDRILFEIENRLRLSLAIYCPHLNSTVIQANLLLLPESLSQADLNKFDNPRI